jgi:fucose permease
MLILLLIIIYLAFIGIGLPNSLLGAAWPSMYESMGVPDSYLGITAMIIVGGTVIASAYSGKLRRHFRTGKIISVCTLMIAAALIGFAFSNAFILLCVFAVPLGLGLGLIDAVLNDYVAVHFKAKHLNWLHCFWGVGATAGPIILSYGMIRSGSWRWGYFAIGGIQLALVLILILALPLWKIISEGKEETETSQKLKFRMLFRLKGIKLSLASFFCYCSMEASIGVWGSSYLVMVKNVSAGLAAQWISLYFLGITLGRLFSGFLTIKLSNRQLIRLGYVIVSLGIFMALLPFGSTMYPVRFFLLGIGCAPIFPSFMHDTPTNFGKEYSQSVIGLQMAGGFLGAAVTPALFGVVTTHIGYGFFFPFLFILLMGFTITVEMLNKKFL